MATYRYFALIALLLPAPNSPEISSDSLRSCNVSNADPSVYAACLCSGPDGATFGIDVKLCYSCPNVTQQNAIRPFLNLCASLNTVVSTVSVSQTTQTSSLSTSFSSRITTTIPSTSQYTTAPSNVKHWRCCNRNSKEW